MAATQVDIITACKNLNLDQIKAAISAGGDPTISWSEFFTRGGGKVKVTHNLISCVVDYSDDELDETLASHALEICEFLVKNGADLEFPYYYDFISCWATLTPVLMTLSACCTFKTRNIARVPRCFKLLKKLISLGANVNAKIQNISKNTNSAIVEKSAIYIACVHCAEEVATEFMLSGSDVNFGTIDYNGYETAMHRALKNHMSPYVVHLLFACGFTSEHPRNVPASYLPIDTYRVSKKADAYKSALLNPALQYSLRLHKVVSPAFQVRADTLLLCFFRLNIPLCKMSHPGTLAILSHLINDYVLQLVCSTLGLTRN